jgi:hypothetical protein
MFFAPLIILLSDKNTPKQITQISNDINHAQISNYPQSKDIHFFRTK